MSDYNTATAEYNFILLFEKEEENAVCMEKALQACSKIQVEVERYLKADMNFGLSDVEVDEYQANAQHAGNVFIWVRISYSDTKICNIKNRQTL